MLFSDPLSPKAIEQLKREFRRKSTMTTYQRINETAADHKADQWRAYQPLTHSQLTDYDMVDGKAESLAVTIDWLALIAPSADPRPPNRSTQRAARPYKQFVVIARPTETLAIRQALESKTLPLAVLPRPGRQNRRWCIYCQDRHPVSAFIRNKRYLHNLSYACKESLRTNTRIRRVAIA